MQRVVVDANVWVSAAFNPESIPGMVVRSIEDKVVQSVISRVGYEIRLHEVRWHLDGQRVRPLFTA